ncbi:sodium:solute symporter family protein [Kushneria aurantia]|uniref:sodium:solute symporter family protein n=1 Tax=Kushneria aurantia TaxID=504092 RepID=UPI0003FA993C|nr:sodium:solute symporter family protein [Kushneria aurantia]
MSAYVWSVVVSLIVYLVVGGWAGKAVRNVDDYFVAGRNAPTLLIVGTLVASYLSTGLFLGETGFAYDGFPFLMLALSTISVNGSYLGAVFFGRYLRRSEALTIPEFFGKRFDSPGLRQIAGLTTIFGVILYLLGVMQGISVMLSELTHISYELSLIIVWCVFTSFTFYSGSKGVLLTDTIMFLVFGFAAIAGSVFIIHSVGGWQGIIDGLYRMTEKSGIVAWHGHTGEESFLPKAWQSLLWLITLGLVWASVLAVSPWQSGRHLMAKNEQVVIRSGMITTLSLAVIYLLLMPAAASLNLFDADIVQSERAMVWAALNVFPFLLGVLTLSGIFAAGLSSCSTFLSLVGFSLVNDIFVNTNLQERTLLYSRLSILFSSIVALVLALIQPPAIMAIVWFSATLFASSWGPVGFMSIWCRWITKEGAVWGMVLGFLGNLIPAIMNKIGMISLPAFLDPVIFGALFSVAAIYLISKRSTPTEKALQYLEKLTEKGDENLPARESRLTLFTSLFMMLAGASISLFMIINYAGNISSIGAESLSQGDILGGYVVGPEKPKITVKS